VVGEVEFPISNVEWRTSNVQPRELRNAIVAKSEIRNSKSGIERRSYWGTRVRCRLKAAGPHRILLLTILAIFFLVAQVMAQMPERVQPAQQEKASEPERRPGRPDIAQRPSAPIREGERAPEVPREKKEGPTVFVKKFRVSGNTVISTQKLEALIRSAEGKDLTLEELRAVAGRITEYYAAQGYLLARAYLPPQDVREGVIEIAVLEGYVGDIEVTGNVQYDAGIIKQALTRVENAKVVNEALLETAINELNDYPGLNVRASLQPGKKRGFTDITLSAQERLPHSLLFDIDNYGSRYTGPWRYGTELTLGNLMQFGDKLTFRGIKSDDDLNYARVSFVVPVGGYGTKLGFNYAHAENGVGEEFAPLEAAGRLDVASIDMTQTMLRTAGASFQFAGGFDYKTIRNFTLNALAGKDDLRVFRFGFSGDYRDPFLGRTFYGMTWHQGTTTFNGNPKNDPGATRTDNPGNFTKFTFDLARLQSLVYGGSYLILRGTSQLSAQNLQSVERFGIGGYYTVRGYPMFEYLGDHGYSATAELVVPVPYVRQWVQAAGFVDHGGVFVVSPNRQTAEVKQHWLTGVGAGLRINLPVPYLTGSNLQFRLDYAVPVTDPSPSSRKGTPVNGRPGVLYFSSSVRF